jgi:hypothetical protein
LGYRQEYILNTWHPSRQAKSGLYFVDLVF